MSEISLMHPLQESKSGLERVNPVFVHEFIYCAVFGETLTILSLKRLESIPIMCTFLIVGDQHPQLLKTIPRKTEGMTSVSSAGALALTMTATVWI